MYDPSDMCISHERSKSIRNSRSFLTQPFWIILGMCYLGYKFGGCNRVLKTQWLKKTVYFLPAWISKQVWQVCSVSQSWPRLFLPPHCVLQGSCPYLCVLRCSTLCLCCSKSEAGKKGHVPSLWEHALELASARTPRPYLVQARLSGTVVSYADVCPAKCSVAESEGEAGLG